MISELAFVKGDWRRIYDSPSCASLNSLKPEAATRGLHVEKFGGEFSSHHEKTFPRKFTNSFAPIWLVWLVVMNSQLSSRHLRNGFSAKLAVWKRMRSPWHLPLPVEYLILLWILHIELANGIGALCMEIRVPRAIPKPRSPRQRRAAPIFCRNLSLTQLCKFFSFHFILQTAKWACAVLKGNETLDCLLCSRSAINFAFLWDIKRTSDEVWANVLHYYETEWKLTLSFTWDLIRAISFAICCST